VHGKKKKGCIAKNAHRKQIYIFSLHHNKEKIKSSFTLFPYNKLTLHCISSFFFFCEASLHYNSFFCATRKKKSLSVVASACSKKTHVARRKKRACNVVFLSMQQACVENNVIG
jgi:hypothetical protein